MDLLLCGLVLGLAGFWTLAPRAFEKKRGLVALALAAWLGLTSVVALKGGLHDFRMPMPGIILVFVIAFSPVGKRLAHGLSFPVLIGFQSFRVLVEFLLAGYYSAGLLPVQMTFHGRNFDILTGLSAIVVAWLARSKKASPRLILFWNCVGLALLLNIMTIAVLSIPGPTRVFLNEPANTLVFGWPQIWIPTVFVTSALLGHLLVFRKLNAKN